MQNTALRVKLENVKKLIRRNARSPLYKTLNKLHPADIAYIINHLEDIDRKRIWAFLHDRSRIGEILLEMEEADVVARFREMSPKMAGEVLTDMESDDASYVLRLLPDEIKQQVAQFMSAADLTDVEELLHYPENTAGAMMNTEYIAILENTTVKEATRIIQKSEDTEMIYYLYVVSEDNKLVGVLSLRQLILNPPEKTLSDIMERDLISVSDSASKEDVAALVERYDFLALPVVDENQRLAGIITFDDVIDVIRDEAAQDIYRMAGTSPEALAYDETAFRRAKARLPWLMITLAGQMLCAMIIAGFKGRVTDYIMLSVFMPVIMAMGGNVGSQSSMITIRNMSIGKIDPTRPIPVLFKDLRVGVVMGFATAIPVTFIAPFIQASPNIGIVVGVALFCAMSFSSVSGAFVPMLFTRLKVDPAVASGPFITTFNDMTGLTIYFTVAMTLSAIL